MMKTKSIFIPLLLTAQALFADLQLTGLKVEMAWDNPYQPTELRYQLETDFLLGSNATIDPLKDNVFLGRIFPNDPSIIFFIPAGGFTATAKGFEVLDAKAAGVTIQRVKPPGPNNEPPKLVDDLSDLWSDVRIRLRTSDGVNWQCRISAEFAADVRVLPVTRVPSLVQLNIGDDAGVMEPRAINFKSPRDPASGMIKANVSLNESALNYDLSASWLAKGAALNPLKDNINVVVEIPTNPCFIVAIPSGAFTAVNNGFVVKDPKAAGVTIQLVAPGDPSNNTPPTLVGDLTGLWTDLGIRLRSKDGIEWQLLISAAFPRDCDFQGGCNVLSLFHAADQVNLSAGDDKLSAPISHIEYAD